MSIEADEGNLGERITVRLDDELARALDKFCGRLRRRKADVTREALVKLLEQEGCLRAQESPSGKEAA